MLNAKVFAHAVTAVNACVFDRVSLITLTREIF